ncbi:MAG: hypothetical protein BMS9Abin19_0651 [Gammaproteobacteria bacterium]|nr:MAG: hypothetical protein BMS9Abin19_0651 [Gammaproteobacteria bacterium]
MSAQGKYQVLKKPHEEALLCLWMDGMSQRAMDGGATNNRVYYRFLIGKEALVKIQSGSMFFTFRKNFNIKF